MRLTGQSMSRIPLPHECSTLLIVSSNPTSGASGASSRDRCAADFDETYLPIHEACNDFTMTGALRMHALFEAVKYVVAAKIDGDIVECGVWRGGSAMVAAMT